MSTKSKPLVESSVLESVSASSISDEEVIYELDEANKPYLIKSKLVSDAITQMGWGKYQWGLFFVAGFGWLADNAWPVITSLILGRLTEVDGVHPPPKRAPYLTLAQNLGLLGGAAFWSLSSDIIGRRWAFNLTFLITGIFAVIAGGMPNFAGLGVCVALWSFGVGGNLPVDSAIFLEALPGTHQWVLTTMSGWWSLGQIIATLISWALVSNFSCDGTSVCHKKDNWGWRYFVFTMGGITLLMFVARFAFRVFESPKFHLARGDDELVIETLDKIAKINGTVNPLSLEDLQRVNEQYGKQDVENALLKEKLSKYKLTHIRECFATKRAALSSGLIILSWGLIGLAFPLYNAFLPYYLETRGSANKPLSVHETYRNTLIVAVVGIPGVLLAGFLVELRIGRKGTLIASLVCTGVFLFASTTAKTSNANLGWNCAFSFFSSMMYAVLYAYTPEVFVTKIRGTGVGLAASFNRIFGVFAPIIAIFADLTTSAPIFVSGALFLVSAVLVVFYPYEPRGRTSL